MKLLRIGSNNCCSIIYHNPYVSGVHAELLMTDDGQMFLSDKNSTNGTFVGNTRISPNEEVKVQRGDLIRFGEVELDWRHVPSGYGPKKGETWYNIGTSQRNEVVVSSQFASRYHAILMEKDKKFYLMDNDSKNGTMVNGTKIAKNKFVRIKRKDNVICGDVDVSEQIAPLIKPGITWWMWLLIGLASAAAFVGIFWGISQLVNIHDWPKEYAQAVVYVDAAYHYDIVFENTPIGKDIWDGVLTYNAPRPFSATAFFIDRNGVLATNRHVANPGEYQSEEEKTTVRNNVNEFIARQIKVEQVSKSNFDKDLDRLRSTELGAAIVSQWLASGSKSIQNLNTMIKAMLNAPFTIKSVLDYVTVGYPGRYYTHRDEYERCFVLGVSSMAEKDVALLQLNTKKTPESIKQVIDINRYYDGKIEPLKDHLVWIGYPRGNDWGLDESIHSLLPQSRETQISKVPGRYVFEFQGESAPGGSGSPIFDKRTGRLFGIIFGGRSSAATYGMACQAKCIKELYDEYKDIIDIQ